MIKHYCDWCKEKIKTVVCGLTFDPHPNIQIRTEETQNTHYDVCEDCFESLQEQLKKVI